ncbi:NUDIX hydrolase [Allorhizocola rhizosphaerae]|uniref:NUDIX hydrolase n=1 Tax=Allorhizocola rhizosphaerae TaxID=1872709 RepID=UPI000E3DDE65|nr:8-oxo-dGTP diphosphatase [Allorhizocola rhizosphaerae]
MTTVVLATLAYILSSDRESVLLLHRDKRPDDIHYGKYLGLGGRVEPDEDVLAGVKREIKEESGLLAERLTLRGTVLWPGFGKGGQNWFGFIFRVDEFSGTPHGGNAEGTLEWVQLKDIGNVPMWQSDHEWLPMVFDADPRQFHGVMPYHEGRMVSWSYQRD